MQLMPLRAGTLIDIFAFFVMTPNFCAKTLQVYSFSIKDERKPGLAGLFLEMEHSILVLRNWDVGHHVAERRNPDGGYQFPNRGHG